ncbi:MAG: hypothetical protein QG620_251 [Patescibacteria group bacterium]|nr:hypothetical protein [Patescibacteria group bacterium]
MLQKENKDIIGGISKKDVVYPVELDLPLFKFVKKRKQSSFLFSSRGKSAFFSANDWGKHEAGRQKVFVDGLFLSKESTGKALVCSTKPKVDIYLEIRGRYVDIKNYWLDLFQDSVQGVSLARAWNVSLIGSVIFGMFLMTMIYRYLGQGVSAKTGAAEDIFESRNELVLDKKDSAAIVLGENDSKADGGSTGSRNMDKLLQEKKENDKKREEYEDKLSFEREIKKMVKGYPIEKMAAEIAKKDRTVAAYLVAIAKKESSWGERVPVLDGEDCYNYWGYRGKREKMGTGGHTCFNSPKDAVDTVAKRIAQLVNEEKLNTPEEMVVAWKCGYDCSWDSPEAVRKWASDVEGYFNELK